MKYSLHNFISDVNKIIVGVDSNIEDCEPSFRKFLKSDDLFSTINRELGCAQNDLKYLSQSLHGNSLVVHAEPNWSLLYTLYEHIPAHLYSAPLKGLISPAPRCEIECDMYDLPPTYSNLVPDMEAKLSNKRSLVVKAGEVLLVDGSKEIWDIRLTSPVAALRLYIPTKEPLQWVFDRTSFKIVNVISTTTGTELVLIAQVLGMLKNRDSIGALQRLAIEHTQHHVRWEAVKAVAQIDIQKGLESIRIAVEDAHPHVSAAAHRTLKNYVNTVM